MTWLRENSALRRWSGPLTESLALKNGGLPGLGRVPAQQVPDQTVQSVCGFCSTGCSLDIHVRNGKPVNLTADPRYPVNQGMACPKGWEALTPLRSPDRAVFPRLRDSAAERFHPVSWDEALSTLCFRFKALQKTHGPDALAFLTTGQIATEEMALLGALAKFGMNIRHGDGNTRQCMATAVAAYKESLGFDAPPYTYRDFEESDVLVFVGANPCVAHPILWQRVMQNRRNPEILVVDPRKTETAMAATRHYPIRPKSDLALFYALAHALDRRGWIDADYIAAHTSGYAAFRQFIQDYAPQAVAAGCGLSVEQIEELAGLLKPGRRVSYWWTMGINQSHEGTRTAQALINLALMTGNFGKPGTGANSITGQCNAMGSRLFSNTTNLLGGHSFSCPRDRGKVASILGIDPAQIPSETGHDYARILDEIERGTIKGLWVVATNPAHSWIQQDRFKALREKLEFFVVQDMYANTETARIADLVLPSAGWGEKEGTFINSERRIGRIKKVAEPPGEALTDFEIFQRVGRHWGCGSWLARWENPEAVFHLLKRLSQNQPCDFSGVEDYLMIEKCGGIQWPFPKAGGEKSAKSGGVSDERRLFEDGRFFTPDRRARFIFQHSHSPAERPDSQYPFALLTGRGTSAQWHTQTRTGKSSILRKLYPAGCYVEIHPADARRLGLQEGDQVTVQSRRGDLQAKAFVTPTVQPWHVFLPMHYPEVNRLTRSSFDPYSKQPAYKYCAVRLCKS